MIAQASTGTSQTHANSQASVCGNARAPSIPVVMRAATRTRVSSRSARRSDAMREAIGQRPRQPRGDDLLSGRPVVVLDSTDRHGAVVPIPDRVRGAGIAVPRLPHAADVDDVATAVFEL